MMKSKLVNQEEERIRESVSRLSIDDIKVFYEKTSRQIKDPDTYQTLNYIFICGLHHFYIGKYLRGLTNLLSFIIGIVLLFLGYFKTGILLIVIVFVIELYELFRSNVIIKDYNNKLMNKTLLEVTEKSIYKM